MKPCRNIPILIFLSLINFLPATGQDTTKDARNQTKLTAPAAIPLTEIPGSREQLNNRLQQISDILKNIPEIEEIQRKLEELKLATKDLTNIGDEKKLRNMSNRERKDLLQRAELFRAQLTSWQSSLESRIQSLQTEKEDLEKIREIWE